MSRVFLQVGILFHGHLIVRSSFVRLGEGRAVRLGWRNHGEPLHHADGDPVSLFTAWW